jgi:hypothetical protein
MQTNNLTSGILHTSTVGAHDVALLLFSTEHYAIEIAQAGQIGQTWEHSFSVSRDKRIITRAEWEVIEALGISPRVILDMLQNRNRAERTGIYEQVYTLQLEAPAPNTWASDILHGRYPGAPKFNAPAPTLAERPILTKGDKLSILINGKLRTVEVKSIGDGVHKPVGRLKARKGGTQATITGPLTWDTSAAAWTFLALGQNAHFLD